MLAAGGLLWRPSRRHGIRVALVHRPRYDDWSLPKGKAAKSARAEPPAATAAREVVEETGFTVALGRSLTTVSYTVAGGPKTVRYFAARAVDGQFRANREVDRLEWFSPAQARSRMTYEFDRAVLSTFQLERPDLSTVVVVRHARAGQRESYPGSDANRPLDAKGERQARALVEELLPFRPLDIRAATLERCLATVAPLAQRLGLPVLSQVELTEERYRDDPAAARHLLVRLAQERLEQDSPGSVVACSQGGVIPGAVKSLAARSEVSVPKVSTPKASFWVLSFDGRRLVQADPFPAPIV